MYCHDFRRKSLERLEYYHDIYCMVQTPLGIMSTVAYMPRGYNSIKFVTRLPDFGILVAKVMNNAAN